MQYVLSIIFALLLVVAQVSWKLAVERHAELFSAGITVKKLLPFIASSWFLAGVFMYGFATLLYFYLLSRYEFSIIQALAIPLSLLFSLLAASILFNEKLTPINVFGAFLVITGILLLVLRLK